MAALSRRERPSRRRLAGVAYFESAHRLWPVFKCPRLAAFGCPPRNLLAFGPPGSGKSHLLSGIGHALIDAGKRVLFMRCSDLVQRLQAARRDLRMPQELTKLDRFDLLVLDDLSYVRRDQAETSVLFELIAERYERKSIAITANTPFSQWGDVFVDPAMTLAAIDRLVHHATILEMNTESYRRRSAEQKQARAKK